MASSMSVSANEPQFRYSPFISERRRALFPKEKDDSDSDLGHISPLNYDSNSDILSWPNSPNPNPDDFQPIDTDPTPVTPTTKISSINSETMSPLILSPLSHGIPPVSFYGKNKPFSPSQAHKTPHDSGTTATNSKMPKLIRKSLLDSLSVAENAAKRKAMSPENEPLLKLPKLEPNPKIRTALFKDNSISTKTFYPKPSGPSGLYRAENQPKSVPRKSVPIKRSNKRTIRRNARSRSQLGSINAGVRHKIRRPKVNLLDREFRLQAALNILENSPLNDYLYDEKLSRESQKQIMPASDTDSNKENVAPGPSRKRDHSPSPDPTKKFFKHSHAKATVTMSKTMKLELDHGRLSLLSKSKPKVGLDASDLLTDDSPEKVVDVDSILNTLDTTIILEASNSVTASDNSIVLHAPTNKRTEDIKKPETMLSPTSVMCNMTSGLALNSPKKAKNLTAVLENLPAANSEKLYPIFESNSPKGGGKAKDDIRPVKSVSKVWKKLPKDQMLLDAGQKRFGYTLCAECDTFYHMGDPGDELMHFNYHNAVHVFKFPGWKDEKVVRTIPPDGRIIQTHTSCKPRLRRILEILDYVNREFGFSLPEQELDATVFLYIKNRTIVGFMMAQKYTTAYKMLSAEKGNLCSRETYPIQCTVSHIWVSPNHRQKGIGSALVDALKSSFMPGRQLSNADIAFSSPTEAGHKFCQKYFKTVNYLVTF